MLIKVMKFVPQKSNCLLVCKDWRKAIDNYCEFTLYIDESKVVFTVYE